MIFMGLVYFSGLRGKNFLVESARHLARRRSRASDLWALLGFVL